MIIDLTGKVIVVTGSSRGIGSEMAKVFARENAKIVINYFHSYQNAVKLYEEIRKYNQNCIMVKADVTKQDEVKKLCRETIKAFQQVDVLVNNAGICSDNLIPLMTEQQWKNVMDVNLNSIFLCSKIFAKEMMKRRQGKILNITSIKGQLGSEGQTNYSASKAGVIGFTKALAKELGMFNISVNAVCPGFIVTDLNRHDGKKKAIAAKMSAMSTHHSLDDLLNFLIFLSSDSCAAISGRTFNLDSRIF